MSIKLKSGQVPVVFVMTETTGKLGGMDSMGLHEVILCRQKVVGEGESLIIHKEWPGNAKQFQVRADNLRDVNNRLVVKYGKERVEDVYGLPHQGRLKSVMERIYDAFTKNMPYEKIVELGRPDGDFIEVDGLNDEAEDEDDDKVSSVGDAADEAANAPDPAHAATGGMKPLGGDDDDDDDAPSIDGALIAQLEEQGWNNVQSTNVARLVLEVGYDAIPDDRLKEALGVNKEDARRRIREHLSAYRESKGLGRPKKPKAAKPKPAKAKKSKAAPAAPTEAPADPA